MMFELSMNKSEKKTPRDDFIFFFSGDEAFRAIEAAMQDAKESIELEFYIIGDDALAWSFAEILAKKAQAGVKVRLIYDAIGCLETGNAIFEFLVDHDVEVKKYHPFFSSYKNLFRRDHRKLVIVDHEKSFLGGFNLAAEYSEAYWGNRSWRDSGVQINDLQLTRELLELFESTWGKKRQPKPKAPSSIKLYPPWMKRELHVIGGHGHKRKSLIRQEYLAALIHAKKYIYICNPYFIPDLGILRALKRATRRGVEVIILTTGETDVEIAKRASQAIYGKLLKKGVHIFEYQKSILHAKTAVIDDQWFTIGTANIDHMSFFYNLEVNLFGSDDEAACILAAQFQKDLKASREIHLSEWQERSAFDRNIDRLYYYFRAWL